jgi:RecA-family ATPase
LRLLQLIAVALGRGELVGEHVFKRTKVLLVCLEDDEDELRRRIRAACLRRAQGATLQDWRPRL